jgi:hypothetical protein
MNGNEENHSTCDNNNRIADSCHNLMGPSRGDGGVVSLKRKSPQDYTYYDLEPYFHLPIIDAARELKVCQTFLKKICRMNNIRRWPYRKLKSTHQLANCATEDEIRTRQQQIVVTTEKSLALTEEELELIKEEFVLLDQQQQQQQQFIETMEPSTSINFLYRSNSSGEIPFFSNFHLLPNSHLSFHQTDILRIGKTHANFILYESEELSHVKFLGPVRLAPIDSIPSTSKSLIPVCEPDLLYSSTTNFVPYSLLGAPPRNLSSPTCYLSTASSSSTSSPPSSPSSSSMPNSGQHRQHTVHFSSTTTTVTTTSSTGSADHTSRMMRSQPYPTSPSPPLSEPSSFYEQHPTHQLQLQQPTTTLPPKKTRRLSPPLFVTDSEQDRAISQGMSTLLEPPSPFTSLDSLLSSSSYEDAPSVERY